MVKAVIFDLDGTLLDTRPVYTKATELAFPDMKKSSHLEYGLAIGRAIEQYGFVEFLSTHTLNNWLDLWIECQYDLARPFNDSKYILQKLNNQNVLLAINTNRPQSREKVESVLEHHDLLKYIQFTMTSQEVGVKKPNPAGLLEICCKFNENPQNVVCIGDSVADIKAAQKINMKIIAVTTGIFEAKDLRNFHPDKVVMSLTDALHCIPK